MKDYFPEKPWACGCGFDRIDPELVERLNRARELASVPFEITSACRCSRHNAAEGGTPTSLGSHDRPGGRHPRARQHPALLYPGRPLPRGLPAHRPRRDLHPLRHRPRPPAPGRLDLLGLVIGFLWERRPRRDFSVSWVEKGSQRMRE
jgi:hypothetical protein